MDRTGEEKLQKLPFLRKQSARPDQLHGRTPRRHEGDQKLCLQRCNKHNFRGLPSQ